MSPATPDQLDRLRRAFAWIHQAPAGEAPYVDPLHADAEAALAAAEACVAVGEGFDVEALRGHLRQIGLDWRARRERGDALAAAREVLDEIAGPVGGEG